MEIENVPVVRCPQAGESFRRELIQALRAMECGQSVVVDKADSNLRTLVWVVSQCLDRRYLIRKQAEKQWRIGRID